MQPGQGVGDRAGGGGGRQNLISDFGGFLCATANVILGGGGGGWPNMYPPRTPHGQDPGRQGCAVKGGVMCVGGGGGGLGPKSLCTQDGPIRTSQWQSSSFPTMVPLVWAPEKNLLGGQGGGALEPLFQPPPPPFWRGAYLKPPQPPPV